MSNKLSVSVSIQKVLSPDLALRVLADRFFDYVEALAVNDIVVDFAGVASISRSFAHQYILRKARTQKNITEVNVPAPVQRMFQIVQQPKTETVLADIEDVRPLRA